MILARNISADRVGDLELAFARLALPRTAREYLLEKIPHRHVLLTGLEKTHGRVLRTIAEESNVPRDEYPHFVSGDQAQRPGTALLSGRRDQFDRLLKRIGDQRDLVDALTRLFASESGPAPLTLAGKTFEFGARTYVMGVINVTPDSFSDGGKFFDATAAIEHGLALAKAGADIIDIGGESTRPGAPAVSVEHELERVLPVITALKASVDVPISIDTTKAAVAAEALKAGASLVNDISGFHFDKELATVTAEAGAACCLMHIQGTPDTMQIDPRYGDAVEEILHFLAEGIERATAAGVPRGRILVDPGIGFGKTVDHNLFLLRRLADFRSLGCAVLVGTSRKAFLGKLTGGKAATERLAATLGSVAAVSALGSADVVRVHDVSEVRDALVLSDAVRNAVGGGELFARPVAGPKPRA